MKKLGKWWQWALLAAFAAALVFGAVQAKQVGDHLQYLVPAPAQQTEDNSGEDENSKTAPNQPIADQVKALENAAGEWDTTTMLRWTIGGVIEKTSISGGDISSDTRVELVGKYGFQVRPKLLRYGRLPYEEELKSGRKVAVLDEDLALKLFRVADPLGRKVFIGGESYEVIGIARHSMRVGEYQAYTAYIPLNSVIETSTTVDALLVEAIPKPGTGASVSFKSAVTGWQSGGSMFDLGKEGMSATLWLRVLLFLIGMTVLLRFIAFLNGRVKHYGKRYRQRLQEKVCHQLDAGADRRGAAVHPRLRGIGDFRGAADELHHSAGIHLPGVDSDGAGGVEGYCKGILERMAGHGGDAGTAHAGNPAASLAGAAGAGLLGGRRGTAGCPLRADALVPSAGGGQRECAVSSGRDSLRHPHAQGD